MIIAATERLLIRQFRFSDYEAINHVFGDAEAMHCRKKGEINHEGHEEHEEEDRKWNLTTSQNA